MAKKLTLLKGERLTSIFGEVMHLLVYRDIRPNETHRCSKKNDFFQSCSNNLKILSIEEVYQYFLLLKDERLIPNTDSGIFN